MARILLGGGGHRPIERRTVFIEVMRGFLGGLPDSILFVPYALEDRKGYFEMMSGLGFGGGYRFETIEDYKDPKEAIATAQTIFVGGGNTFRLLYWLKTYDLINLIRTHVLGMSLSYIGVSAGTNVACPTIKTTNDMPIIDPKGFDALSLVPFQVNPHYVDADPNSTFQGETREQRIAEFHEVNDTTVVGMKEGSILQIFDNDVILDGTDGAKVFCKGGSPIRCKVGDNLNFLLARESV